MEEKNGHLRFWEELAQEAEGKSGGKRYLNKLKKSYLETDFKGEEVLCLKEGPSYQKAFEMVSADVEFLACVEKLRHADERRRFKEKEFWLSILEETGLDEDAGLIFDPLHLRVLSKKSNKERSPGSHQLSLDGYKDLIMAALVNPLNASRMVSDPFLKFSEIKHMAQAITDGDFKPNLRKIIEEWVEDPAEARDSKSVLVEENMPEWLVEIATKLGQRRKWS